MADEPRDAPLLTLNPWHGKHAEIFTDDTPELDVEGARMSAKTTLCLDKEIHFLKQFPGIHSFMCRYSDTATRTKLRPRFERICAIRRFTDWEWDGDELAYHFANGSKMFAFGLKSVSASLRYEKLRGLDVARVLNDQSEELPADIGEELRASIRQSGFPHQLTFAPNPPDTNHWLALPRHGGFPIDNAVNGRRYIGLSLYDNAYNLPAETIAMMERTYPPDHAKHDQMILGKRGPNVIGVGVYADVFSRSEHVRAVEYDPDALLLEAFHFGQHNPSYVAVQRQYAGGPAYLAGLLAEGLFLGEFLDVVKRCRAEWFEDIDPSRVRTCCQAPAPGITVGNRYTALSTLRAHGFQAIFRDNSESADVRSALIDNIATYMRTLGLDRKPMLAVNSDPARWFQVSRDGPESRQFLAQAFEANYVWDDHAVSVSNAKFRQPKLDDRFANGMRCAENIELNFFVDQPTPEALDQRRRNAPDWFEERRPVSRTPASWMGV